MIECWRSSGEKKCLSCPLLLALSSNWINTYSMAVTFFTFYWKWMRKTFNSQPPSPVWLHYLWMTRMSIDGFSVTPSLDLAVPLLQRGAVHLHSKFTAALCAVKCLSGECKEVKETDTKKRIDKHKKRERSNRMTNHALDKHWGHSLGEGEVLEVKLRACDQKTWVLDFYRSWT